jgi:hypothetical protein
LAHSLFGSLLLRQQSLEMRVVVKEVVGAGEVVEVVVVKRVRW